ncbi:MAG: M56 family metallopeptidase, partial [Tannerella sp.]|nr:M56 family metallopeptidase [Tannerella sp.]
MMGTFFAFSLKSALCLAVFYLFYKPLLSSEIFHRLNRATLLAIMALSLCIPLIAVFFVHVPAGGWTEPLLTEPAEAFLSEQPETPDGFAPSGGSRLHAVLLLIYLAGCGIFMLHTLWSLCRIVRLIRKSACRRLDGQIRLAVHADSRIMPFSWMNCIVVSRKDHDENADIIIRHEQSHIRRRHTADLLFAGICLLFQWYNPAAWLIYAELQNVHEYEADRDVLDGGADAKQYQLLLIRKTVGPKLYSMASSFNHSNLKKRITMMLQKNSNSWARLKYACVLPLAAICMAAFARPEIARPFDGISNVGIDHFV